MQYRFENENQCPVSWKLRPQSASCAYNTKIRGAITGGYGWHNTFQSLVMDGHTLQNKDHQMSGIRKFPRLLCYSGNIAGHSLKRCLWLR